MDANWTMQASPHIKEALETLELDEEGSFDEDANED